LKNKLGYQVFAVQFISVDWKNCTVCLALVPSSAKDGQTVAKLFQGVVNDILQQDFQEVANRIVQDQAASSVSNALGFELEPCEMHVGDGTLSLLEVCQCAVGLSLI